MKLYSFFSIVSILFFGSTSLMGELSLYEQVSIERRIYQEISELSLSEDIKRDHNIREALRECHNTPDDLVNIINAFIGPVREKGPSYNTVKLELLSSGWVIPLVPSIILPIKFMYQTEAIPSDMGLVWGSIVAGFLMHWGCLKWHKKLKRAEVTQSAGSMYDIPEGYRYFRLNLLEQVKQAARNNRMKRRKAEALKSGRPVNRKRT